jgi:hypothetical protein
MRLLIAIVSCHKRREFVEAQRATWLSGLTVDYKVFLGRPTLGAGADEVLLDVCDSYAGLPEKVKSTCAWALQRKYDYVLKVDDDSYLFPDRYLASGFEKHDYTGCPGGNLNDFAAGFCYCLSSKAMKAVVSYPLLAQVTSEDRWVAQAVLNGRMVFLADERYRLLSAPPRIAKPFPADTIACCEYDPEEMRRLHKSEGGRSGRVTFGPCVDPSCLH